LISKANITKNNTYYYLNQSYHLIKQYFAQSNTYDQNVANNYQMVAYLINHVNSNQQQETQVVVEEEKVGREFFVYS
jgi:hypothetical protein